MRNRRKRKRERNRERHTDIQTDRQTETEQILHGSKREREGGVESTDRRERERKGVRRGERAWGTTDLGTNGWTPFFLGM